MKGITFIPDGIWVLKIVLFSSGNQDAWDLKEYVPLGLAKLVKIKLIENYKQEWGYTVFNSSKCLNYRILSQNWNLNNILVFFQMT